MIVDSRTTPAGAWPDEQGASTLQDALDALYGELAAQLTAAELHALSSAVPQARLQAGGSKPLWLLCGQSGTRYVFKQCSAQLAAAEETASELRVLAARPVIRARRFAIQHHGETLRGVVKRYVTFDATHCLLPDTRHWTEPQRTAMLMEHAWEWFLDNQDTNPGQYALLGPWCLPVNIDWDRAFHSRGDARLSRFAKYRAALPNARTFLYCDYVEGRVELSLDALEDEARRIRQLPLNSVVSLLEGYARVRYRSSMRQRRFVARVLQRQARIEVECERFCRSLQTERQRISSTTQLWVGRVRASQRRLWLGWQVALLAAFRGVAGQMTRRALVRLRAR